MSNWPLVTLGFALSQGFVGPPGDEGPVGLEGPQVGLMSISCD